MLSESELQIKYKLVFVGKQRYYLQDLTEKPYALECTTPFSLETPTKNYVNTSWKQLLIDVITDYLAEQPEKKDILLSYSYEWNQKKPFSSEEGKYYFSVGEGLYLLCNLSALHACWLLRDVLQIFGVDLKKCKFVIHRPPFAEPSECRKYFEEKTKSAFRYYYVNLLKKTVEKAEQVIRNIDKLNRYLAKMSHAYDNFYLIDNNVTYFNYKDKLLNYLRFDMHAGEDQVQVADKLLIIFGDFCKAIR